MNIDRIRADTPCCQNKLFVNSCGSSLMPVSVVESIHEYLKAEEEFGGYKVAEERSEEIREFYRQAAILLNCNERNIAFSFNATDAYSRVLSSMCFKAGQAIITSDDDYVSNYLSFIALKNKYGVEIKRIQNQANGDLDLHHFEQLVEENDVALVAITHVPTNTGKVQDVESIGKICKSKELLYLVDACQSVGQLVVDVEKIHCDFLSVTGRKFLRGPRGTGLLYVSDRALNLGLTPLFLDLRAAAWTGPEEYETINTAQRFEIWELPYALLIGLKEALLYANESGMDKIEERNTELRNRLTSNLDSIPGVGIFDNGSSRSNILTVRKDGKSMEETSAYLNKSNVYFSIAQKGNALIDMQKKNLDWVVRLSPHYFNTTEEMDQLAEILDNF